jgi:hypothetical protein
MSASNNLSRKCSGSYGVLPRSDPPGRDTYIAWTLKQPSRLHLNSTRHRSDCGMHPQWRCLESRSASRFTACTECFSIRAIGFFHSTKV